jgi:hypothetical protein
MSARKPLVLSASAHGQEQRAEAGSAGVQEFALGGFQAVGFAAVLAAVSLRQIPAFGTSTKLREKIGSVIADLGTAARHGDGATVRSSDQVWPFKSCPNERWRSSRTSMKPAPS